MISLRVDESPVDELIQEGPTTFRVSGRAYSDQRIFELEQERIFKKTWNFVAHESELTKPGDFKTAHIGTQPVIVTRGQDMAISVLLNRCVHRGAVVCRERSGNTRAFVCPYHAWTYATDGRLTGITGRDDPNGYGPDFVQPEGLQRVARVENYLGFIFACMDADVVPLEQYLAGGAAQVLQRKLQQSPVGKIRLTGKPFVGTYEGNWKFQAENIVDGYHFMYTHKAFVNLQQKFGDSTGDFGVHKGDNAAKMRLLRARGNVRGSRFGHGVNQKPAAEFETLFEGPHANYYNQLSEQYGRQELEWIAGVGVACIFPNFGIIHNQLRVWRPIGPAMTEVTVYPYALEGVSDDYNAGMLRSHERFYGPAGYGAVDDIEVFALNQQGLGATQNDWLILERGMHNEKPLENGEIEGLPSSETVHRAFWRSWREMMSVKGRAVQ
ncbi:MAG: Rieske 2Fe-2S domain-containing protein [Comamonadaceae bacterium]|nr:Rieske 2Fe-2S domain-containing protein [Comamonadaceae bacterium]